MKAKLEEQLKTGYLSRRAIINAALPWNLWRVNPDEYAPGYWDVYFKSAARLMEEYLDTAPDPPSIEDDIVDEAAGDEEGEKTQRRSRTRFQPTLLAKRREFRSLLATVVMATKNFNLSNQFNDSTKVIWEKRLDEHVQYMAGINARRITNAIDGLGITLKPQTREKLMAAASQYGARRNAGKEERDIDDFDDNLRTSGRGAERSSTTGGKVGSERSFVAGGNVGRGGVAARSAHRDEIDDYDSFQSGGGADAGMPRRGARGGGGGRGRRDDDFGFDDKPF